MSRSLRKVGTVFGLCGLAGVLSAGCQDPASKAATAPGPPVSVNQAAPPPPPNASPQQKAAMEMAQQKAREAMQRQGVKPP